MPFQSQPASNLNLDATLCFLSTASLGLLIGVSNSFIQEAIKGDVKSQQLGTVLAFATVAQGCELFDRLSRLASLSVTSTKAQGKGKWRRTNLSIETDSKLLIVRDNGEEGVTAKLNSQFFPEDGDVRLPSPCGTPYAKADDQEYYADGQESPGCLFADDDSQYRDDDDLDYSHISLQQATRGEVQFQTAEVSVGPSTAVFENSDSDSDSMQLKKKGWMFVDEADFVGMARWGKT